LYMAQRGARGYEAYAPERDPYSPRRLSLMGELRRALAGGQFILYCQPKADLRTGRVSAAEALVRWEHPVHGSVRPDEFIPLIESSGLIQPLTQWVLDAALAHCFEWQRAGVRVPFAVNLSTRNLLDPGLVDKVRRALRAWDADPAWLEFEITESLVMADPEASLDCMKGLRANGHKLMIDDYGKGYASLSYLRNLPVDAIKIDQEFVMSMPSDEGDALMVRSTIEVAHHLGRKVIAEGVENREIWEQLAALGCDEAQGYFIAKPMPAADFPKWLAGWRAPIAANAPVERSA
jgi:EAL domain-containing protein (putative c-di-GMP-specific phosphodiesterase class I)